MRRDLTGRQPFRRQRQHHVVDAAEATLMLAHNRRFERAVTITGHVDVDWADISDHGLGARPIARVPALTSFDGVLGVTEMAINLPLESCLEHTFGEIAEQTARPGQ